MHIIEAELSTRIIKTQVTDMCAHFGMIRIYIKFVC